MNKKEFEQSQANILQTTLDLVNQKLTNLKTCSNSQLLKELAQRIMLGRLELENIEHGNGLLGVKCSPGSHPVNIWDNEWADTTKPDFNGGRTNLAYWMVKIQLKEVKNA